MHGNPVGSIHIAPQTWNDGPRQNLYIELLDIATIPERFIRYITHEHAVIVACIGMGEEALKKPEIWGYRIHQWSKADNGVVGSSVAIGMLKKEDHQAKTVWADHCEQEVGNWGVFLPALYKLYRIVKNTKFNPLADLSIEKTAGSVTYKNIKLKPLS